MMGGQEGPYSRKRPWVTWIKSVLLSLGGIRLKLLRLPESQRPQGGIQRCELGSPICQVLERVDGAAKKLQTLEPKRLGLYRTVFQYAHDIREVLMEVCTTE